MRKTGKHEHEPSSAVHRAVSPCAYFDDGRIATLEYVVGGHEQPEKFDDFLAAGYRRIGRIFYRTVCEDCACCIPLRIDVRQFRPSRSQLRTLRLNHDIEVRIQQTAHLTPRKVSLYRKYLRTKHEGRTSDGPDEALDALVSMHYGYSNVIEMDYFYAGRLIGVGIVDAASDALSANYYYWDTDFADRRPGVWSILKEIELAQQMEKTYYYLGFLIEENQKMSYKKFFRPNQILRKGRWGSYLKD